MERYAEIAVDASIGPGRTLTYAIPSGLVLAPGQVAWVPLASRLTTGVVFALAEETEVVGIRPVSGVLDPSFLLSPQQLALARWLSRQTRSSLYQAAALMLPLDYRRRLLTMLRLAPQSQNQNQPDQEPDDWPASQRILEYLRRHRPVEQGRLLEAVAGEATLRRLLRDGRVEREWRWQQPRAGPQYRAFVRLRTPPQEAAQEAVKLPRTARQQRSLLEYLARTSGDGGMEATQARKEFGAGAVTGLERRGLVAMEWRRRLRDPLEGRSLTPEPPPTMTEAQRRAAQAIGESLDGSEPGRSFLLEGVTGSGKTEVYLQAIARCIATGRRAILLVPEISLTPQLTQRLWGRFPGQVALLHSGLTPGQQYDTWWRIREGEFNVVLGSRSAVFAPQPELGLIVLDEEHEWTYKQQEPAPRYHARSVALKLAELVEATVILGSATPDTVTYHRALAGGHRLLRLTERLRPGPRGEPLPAPLAQVQVVDMREELKAGVRSIFSRPLYGALESTLERGEQAILFLNRRGTAGIVQCRECGHVLRCRRCDLPLTYHRETERLVCHGCGARSRPVVRCPACWSRRIGYLGLGTQRVVQEVERAFGARVLRWDRDAARGAGGHQELMERFSRGEAQVLVGTQMIAKGLHLPGVTLVGAMLADLGLYLPDFRAGERAFQLLCQVVGRAGRDETPGRAIIQTYAPEHYAILAASAQDYPSFYQEEVAYRRRHLYPPFSRMAQLLYHHTSNPYAQRQAMALGQNLRATLRARGLGEVGVVGPVPAYPARLRGRYRWHLLLRVPHTAAVELVELLESVDIPQGWRVDVDPVGLA